MGIDIKTPVNFDVGAVLERGQNLWAQIQEEYEYQLQQWFLFLPIVLSLGIALYFALPTEPPLVVGGFSVALSFFLRTLFTPRYSVILTSLLIVSVGLFAAQIRTRLVHTPIIQEEIGPAMVVGTIAAIEDLGEGEGARLILSDLDIEDLNPRATPQKIRLKTRNDDGLYVGQRIEVLSKIHPPSTPLIPGGFDFQRHLYFKGIGGVGFIYKDIKILQDVSGRSFRRFVERARQEIALRVEESMAYPSAGVAIALMVGRKTAIDKEDQEAMRAAGLAHILAISGLHVGLFSGAIFFVVRLFLTAVPGLALRYPVKKYAAMVAILGAVIYMFLAGASIPTQRALVMTGIVFLAIILDRSPISLRLVAFAAFMVLLFFPESLLSASFHMSFAAVTCLIAFYDWLRPHWSRWHRQTGVLRRAGLYFLGVSFTTVIATIATAPFALFHFNQLAAFGILGNLIAVPLLAFVIMPSVLLALVLMPFGLEFLPLAVTDFGVQSVLDIAHWVEALPNSVFRAAIWPSSALVLIVVSALMLILLRGRFRALCFVPLALSIVFASSYGLPDVLVSSKTKLVGVRGEGDDLHVSSMTSDRFVRGSWMESFGLTKEQLYKWPKENSDGPVTCDEMACRIVVGGKLVSFIKDEAVAYSECRSADVAIADFPLRKLCGWKSKVKLVDYMQTRDKGSHAIWLRGDDIRVRTAEDVRGKRAWSGFSAAF